MGKQKLTAEQAEVIKHLYFNKDKKTTDILNELPNLPIARRELNHIKRNERWIEVSTPEYNRGEMLYYMFINQKL